MANLPLVTIIAVCYNQEKWVVETLNSIKNQTHKNIQLIIADDGSKDNSVAVIDNWLNEENMQAVFIKHEKNVGLTKNINSALPHIRGEYFQVFGCDDIMLPEKIESQVALLQSDKELGVVYSDMLFIDKASNALEGSFFEKHTYKKPVSGWLYADLVDRFIISSPSVLVKTAVLEKVTGYNEMLDYEDHDFFMRASKYFKFLYSPAITVKYRISGQSLTGTNTNVKFYKNSFLIYYVNYDGRKEYKKSFIAKLLFYGKSLYYQKFKYTYNYCIKAFFKTGDVRFLKFAVAGLRFYFNSKNT